MLDSPAIPFVLHSANPLRQTFEMQLIRCPHCGHSSADAEFCDACNREIANSQIAPASIPAKIDLGDGQIIDCPFLNQGWPDSNRSEAYEVTWSKPQRARLNAISPQDWPALQPRVEERAGLKISALPPIKVIPTGGGAIVVTEWWEDGNPAAQLPRIEPGTELQNSLKAVWQLCCLYGQLMTELHECNFVWLNFDPEAVEFRGTDARITNLDTVLFRKGECPSRIRVSPRYSPPEVCRFQSERIGPSSDVFHLAMFTYYALGNLLPSGFAGRGLEAFGFQIPQLRIFQPLLPAGIWPVLAKALHRDSGFRYSSVTTFLQELGTKFGPAIAANHDSVPNAAAQVFQADNAFGEVNSTARIVAGPSSSSLAVTEICGEIGSLTITGTAKSSLGQLNQDTIVVKDLIECERQFRVVVVADGVSVSKIGRGELASQTGCRVILDVIRRELAESSTILDWPAVLQRACLLAGEKILEEAQAVMDALPNDATPVADNDIMSTTAVVGIWDGCLLRLANVGDSRAYLISGGNVEQLTIDGDVGTSLLAEGTPPEEVQEMGVAAKSLRYCLGACTIREGVAGDMRPKLACHPIRCRPVYSEWKLYPGDTVVFCTDGLVEEGVFLESDELATIVNAGTNLTAQSVAAQLVCEADQKQRASSAREPAGFGDNIACVVLRC
ncbi:MAG: hypothetical protein JWM11_3475 [Planctomycetaceae bacterium]|nr:hypothetical protein [Planctomycetaceae bacterium]